MKTSVLRSRRTFAFPINFHRPKITGKGTKLRVEGLEDIYVGIMLQKVFMFSS